MVILASHMCYEQYIYPVNLLITNANIAIYVLQIYGQIVFDDYLYIINNPDNPLK